MTSQNSFSCSDLSGHAGKKGPVTETRTKQLLQGRWEMQEQGEQIKRT